MRSYYAICLMPSTSISLCLPYSLTPLCSIRTDYHISYTIPSPCPNITCQFSCYISIWYLVHCSRYDLPLFTNMVHLCYPYVYKLMYLVESNPKFDLLRYRRLFSNNPHSCTASRPPSFSNTKLQWTLVLILACLNTVWLDRVEDTWVTVVT